MFPRVGGFFDCRQGQDSRAAAAPDGYQRLTHEAKIAANHDFERPIVCYERPGR